MRIWHAPGNQCDGLQKEKCEKTGVEKRVIETALSTPFLKEITERMTVISKLAARLGFEPRQNESESFVLPLHHRAVNIAAQYRRAGLKGIIGAGDGIRTRNRLFTKQVLYH